MKWPIVYLRHIKILSCHMEIMCFQQNLTLRWQQCVHIHNQNMHYHIVNVFYIVVHYVHGLIFQVQNQIRAIQMLAPPYYSMSINTPCVEL